MKVVVNINTVNNVNARGINNKEVLREAISSSLRELLPSGSTFTIGLGNRYDAGDIVFDILHIRTYLFHVHQVAPLVNGAVPYVLTYNETSSNVGDIVSSLAKSLTEYFKQSLVNNGFNVKNNQTNTPSSEDKLVERLKTLEEKYRQILVNYALVVRTIDLSEARYELTEKFRLVYQLVMSGVDQHNELLVDNEFNLLEKMLSEFNKLCYEYTSNPPQQHTYPADANTLLREVHTIMDKFFKVFTKHTNSPYDGMLTMSLSSNILSRIETLLNTLIATNYRDTPSVCNSIKEIHDGIDKLEKMYLQSASNHKTQGYTNNPNNGQYNGTHQPWCFNQPAGYQSMQQSFTPSQPRFGYFNPQSPASNTSQIHNGRYENNYMNAWNGGQPDKRLPVYFNVVTNDTQCIDIVNNNVMVNSTFEYIDICPIEDKDTYTVNMVYRIESNHLLLQFTYKDELICEYNWSMLNSSLSNIITDAIMYAEKTIVDVITKDKSEQDVEGNDTSSFVLVMVLADKNKYTVEVNYHTDTTGEIRLISNSKKHNVDVSHKYELNSNSGLINLISDLQTDIDKLNKFLES